MAKKQKCPECPAGEKWAVPYADFLSLLLALFIALYAISAVNTEKTKALKQEFVKIFDYAPKPEQAQPVITIPPNPGQITETTDGTALSGSAENQEQTQESIVQKIQQDAVLEQIEEGVVLKLPTNILFPPSSDTIDDQDTQLFLQRIVEIIHKLPNSIKIDVRGFAMDPNIKNTPFKNNYELASLRAMHVMEFLIKRGIPAKKIFFSSQGEYGKVPRDATKEEIIKQSNRVELYFLVSEQESQKVKNLLKAASPH